MSETEPNQDPAPAFPNETELGQRAACFLTVTEGGTLPAFVFAHSLDHMSELRPSERFVLIHRLFTFLDEWGFYLLLLVLWRDPTIPKWLWLIVLVFGASVISATYMFQWDLDRRLHAPDEPVDSES